MKFVANEGQLMIAGYVGGVYETTDTLTSVSIANNKGKDEVEWLNVAFTKPKEEGKGQDLADFARKYIKKGQFIAVAANEVVNGEYTNYYVNRVELGPKKIA